ncbi:hypothetical protein ACFL42_00955 [Candidatus Omnitrophota bacterium]
MRKMIRTICIMALLCFLSQPGFINKGLEAKSMIREGKPIVTLRQLFVPEEVARGEVFNLRAEVEISKNIWEDLTIFLHILRPSDNKIVINNDFSPSEPSSMWTVGQVVELGPVNVFIPPELSEGEYSIRMGLFGSKATPTGRLYIREPYTNREIKDFVVGKIKVGQKDKIEEEKIEDLMISDFESRVDAKKWALAGSILELDSDSAIEGNNCGKVTFQQGGSASIRLEDYLRYCDPRYTNWTIYDELHFYLYGPADEDGKDDLKRPIILMIKDKAGRRFQQTINEEAGKDKPIVIELAKISEIIDSSNIGDVCFYSSNSSSDWNFFIDDFRLISFGKKEEEGPFVKFEGLELSSDTVRPGENIDIEAKFSVTREFVKNHGLYIHISRAFDRAGYINADTKPWPATSAWKTGEVIAQGPYRIFIPRDSPTGTYNIEMGLFIVKQIPAGAEYIKYHKGKDGTYFVQQPSRGGTDTFKQPYINAEEYGDWVVGSFEIVAE